MYSAEKVVAKFLVSQIRYSIFYPYYPYEVDTLSAFDMMTNRPNFPSPGDNH